MANPIAAGQMFLVVYQHNLNGGELQALDPASATGIGIPAFRPVTALPAAGTVRGEAVINTVSGLSYVWDGARWNAIVPPSIIPYPTDADIWADTTVAPGSYAFSRATGNLFVRYNNGTNDIWRQIGIRLFTDLTAMQAETNMSDGDFAHILSNDTLWVYTGGQWNILTTVSDTEANIKALDPAVYSGAIGVTTDTAKFLISDGTTWVGQPFRTYPTEAAMVADTPAEETLAIAIDTGAVAIYANAAWKVINKNTIPVGTTDPMFGAAAAGDLFYNSTDEHVKFYDGHGWNPVAQPSGWGLGAIQQSILDPGNFLMSLPRIEAGKWRLADGSDITGTDLSVITGEATLPDLRGAYLRMAGQNDTNAAWNGGNLRNFQEDKTVRPDTPFTTNGSGDHNHPPGSMYIRQGAYNTESQWKDGTQILLSQSSSHWKFSGNDDFPVKNNTGDAGDHTHIITGGGDAETRPKTYTVNYYIKVSK